MIDLEIVKMPQKEQQESWSSQENRYMIVEKETRKVVDTAGGYGYKSFESARKAMWYKFKGGKKKIDDLKSEATKFWKINPEIRAYVNDFYMYGFKEIARGELSDNDLINGIK